MAVNKQRHFLRLAVVLLLLFATLFVLRIVANKYFSLKNEEKIEAYIPTFYAPPYNLQNQKPGTLLRKQELHLTLPYLQKTYRILYVTQLPSGKLTVSSGMIFIPKSQNNKRPVIAWAHGTVGMGEACAPSREVNPTTKLLWLSSALEKGFVVVATDYAGLGTEGIQNYLIGRSEAYDVLNSVRAARELPDAHADLRFFLFGHSQGGHSVLFAANIAKNYTPELNLVSVAAAAPATTISELLSKTYSSSAMWLIAPEISVSWPINYPEISLSSVLSQEAQKSYNSLAKICLNGNIEPIEFHMLLKQPFFTKDPLEVSSWRTATFSENAPYLDSSIPLFVAQGLSDPLVLPPVTASYVAASCAKGSNITTLWMKDVNHQDAANKAGPSVISYFVNSLSKPPMSECYKN